ncbi:hypothetical protein ONO86_00697 [Micromonospora noduli]|nr:hypothetical protein ONO86_00697 [Micromonospora noduli]
MMAWIQCFCGWSIGIQYAPLGTVTLVALRPPKTRAAGTRVAFCTSYTSTSIRRSRSTSWRTSASCRSGSRKYERMVRSGTGNWTSLVGCTTSFGSRVPALPWASASVQMSK